MKLSTKNNVVSFPERKNRSIDLMWKHGNRYGAYSIMGRTNTKPSDRMVKMGGRYEIQLIGPKGGDHYVWVSEDGIPISIIRNM